MSERPVRRRATLRTTLVALLVGTVAIMCLAIGAITHVSMREQLSDQLDEQLSRAAQRSLTPRSEQAGQTGQGPGKDSGEGSSADASADAGPGGMGEEHEPSGAPTPSDASEGSPGAGEFELHARIEDGSITEATWRDKDGTQQTVADVSALADAELPTDGSARDVTLSGLGAYRVSAHTSPDGATVITGLPLRPMRTTLTRLDLTLLIASLAALALTGLAGSLIVRRTMRPLEEVARIATDVAQTPLESGSVRLGERVPADAALPGTEVGEVGLALNRLLDNVEGAIDVRQRSEERMRRFIADASHELRTPLTAIRGYSEMLRITEQLSEQGERSVDRLEAQSRRMTSLVEDLLLLARLDDGAPRADDELDLGEILVEATLDAQVTAPDHSWGLDVPDEPVLVRGDARQLTQVVVNLLSNARKHTPAGTRVRVELIGADPVPANGRGRSAATGGEPAALPVRLRVIDDGPGIDAELVGEVFGRFTRADRARSGGENTTGLGLPIVRAIVQSHGGSIDVSSTPGRTVFTVSLPAADATGPGTDGRAGTGA